MLDASRRMGGVFWKTLRCDDGVENTLTADVYREFYADDQDAARHRPPVIEGPSSSNTKVEPRCASECERVHDT